MEKNKIVTTKYLAVSRENVFAWLVEAKMLRANGSIYELVNFEPNKINVNNLPKWAHFEITD